MRLSTSAGIRLAVREVQPRLPPSAVQPQPLLRVFANPALDHAGDRLHGAFDVYLAAGIPHWFDLFRQFGAKAIARQADDANTVDRALDVPRKARQGRVCR